MTNYVARTRFLALLLVVLLTSCSFSKLRKDLVNLDQSTHLFGGTVTAAGLDSRSIMIVAFADSQGDRIMGFNLMSRPGEFQFRSEREPTYFFGFDDRNKDLIFQANEPYGWANDGQPLEPGKFDVEKMTITIAAAEDNASPIPQQLVGVPLGSHWDDNERINVGTVSLLADPLFSMERAKIGLWEPFAFIEGGGAGVHFLESYDPDRTPVLFVHGINGSPRNFMALIDSLDRSRFQAWIFSYPSGLRLPMLSAALQQLLEVLHRTYDFDKLHLVAHSMGGLVSRGSVNLCQQTGSCEYLRSYTTLSTPWNGVASAKSGVEWAPTVVPVWRDLDPSSEFVTSLFDTPLPEDLPYHLIFGFRQDSIFGSKSSDGVIVLSSQLRDAAQEQAQSIRGYDEGHVSILGSEAVAYKLNQILMQSD